MPKGNNDMSMRTLTDCGVLIKGGQILTRVQANENAGDWDNVSFKVLTPKSINSDGTISPKEMSDVKVKRSALDTIEGKIAKRGDIVIKLSTPYDAAIVTEEIEGSLVPSFCAIVKSCGELDDKYLLAFLNSELCKSQIRRQLAGMTVTLASPGKLSQLKIPVPTQRKQESIGEEFLMVQKKLALMREIQELEKMKNNIAFKELEEDEDALSV